MPEKRCLVFASGDNRFIYGPGVAKINGDWKTWAFFLGSRFSGNILFAGAKKGSAVVFVFMED